jgi:hypothetical protein
MPVVPLFKHGDNNLSCEKIDYEFIVLDSQIRQYNQLEKNMFYNPSDKLSCFAKSKQDLEIGRLNAMQRVDYLTQLQSKKGCNLTEQQKKAMKQEKDGATEQKVEVIKTPIPAN